MEMLILKILLGLAALLCLFFIVRGLLLVSRAGNGDALRCKAIVRQVHRRRWDTHLTTVTINAEGSAVHVACRIPGKGISGKAPQPTDIVPVLWCRGDTEAVAERTVRKGQAMLILGFALLAVIVLLAVVMF